MTELLSVGDYVYVGPPRPMKTTWQITSLLGAFAVVKSGQSGRSQLVRLSRLVLHSRGDVL